MGIHVARVHDGGGGTPPGRGAAPPGIEAVAGEL